MILASASPRRKEILERAGLTFTVLVAPVDEDSITADTPVEYALARARAKCEAVMAAGDDPGEKVVAADTIVVIDGDILNKPVDEADAARMLRTLSGRTHEVITAVAYSVDGEIESFSSTTDVTFHELTDDEISWYVSTGEPMDKAGAYGIQELGVRFIERIHGDYHTVVGFPIAAFLRRTA